MSLEQEKEFKLRDIRMAAAVAILTAQPQHRQLNQLRAVLVELVAQIPEEERSESMNALTASDAQINGLRAQSNELEVLATAAESEQELAAIEISF